MADKNIDLNALGQAIDTSWTRSSASSGLALATHSIKASFVPGDKLKVKLVYSCIANMVRDREIQESKTRYEKEGDAYIDAAVKRIVKEYKENVTGEEADMEVEDILESDPKGTIRLKRVDVLTHVEIVDLNIYNNKRSALIRRIAIFEVS
jgi:hypothetical protein